MRIILHKPSCANQASQSAGGLVAMKDTKLCQANRQLSIAAVFRIKDQTMSWTVHWFQRPLLLLDVKCKHVLLVICPVARRLPKFGMKHIWRDDWDNLSEHGMDCSEK